MRAEMLEVAALPVAAGLIGAAVARWWLVPIPAVIAVAWVVIAAATGGEDSDGVPVWEWAALAGAIFTAAHADRCHQP
jgi:hypothetical protein